MGIVLASHSMSLDGFIAQPNGKTGPLHDWLTAGDTPSRHANDFRMSKRSRQFFDGLVDRVGATVAGRRTYDDANGWDGALPFDWPYFIVTHRPPDNASELPFTFVTRGVEYALKMAKEAAGDKDVSVMGGCVSRQCLTGGLLDEIDIDLVPIVLGEGIPFFDSQHSGGRLRLEQTRVVDAPGVTHLRFRVLR